MNVGPFALLVVVYWAFFASIPTYALLLFLKERANQRHRIVIIEGNLPARLADKTIRLLRVSWLLERPANYILQRCQDLPPEAFWSADDAVSLLHAGKVAVLSYRWIGKLHSDPHRFHLERVLAYFREGGHATMHTALLIDFASLPQKDPVTDAERGDEDRVKFSAGLKVMNSAYSSPRVLVLQHKRLPPERERELYGVFGGVAPADRPDLIPYEGRGSRSGWCTMENACALLMTEGSGHVYELGVGHVGVTHGRRLGVEQMEALFKHESTRFIGQADREMVCGQYLDLRKKLEAYDEGRIPCFVRLIDNMMTGDGYALRRGAALLYCPLCYLIFYIAEGYTLFGIFLTLVWLSVFTLPSRIVRAHLAAVMCCRPSDSLDYTFHGSICLPPFRRKPDLQAMPDVQQMAARRTVQV